MYYWGLGVPQNYSLAAKWFQKAAEQGHAEAINYYNQHCNPN
jgi:TPR repeat protein